MIQWFRYVPHARINDMAGGAMELICMKCSGFGEGMPIAADLNTSTNVVGWKPINGWSVKYVRRCLRCGGEGFRPSGQSVPSVLMKWEGEGEPD